MKTCSTCNRAYDDDTLVFCLQDGTRLAATYGPDAGSDAGKTAILPSGENPSRQSPPPLRATVPPTRADYSYGTPLRAEKGGRKIWIVVGILLVLMIVAVIAAAGILIWEAGSNTRTETSQTGSSASTPTQASPANAKQPTPTAVTDWLEGVWEGEGFQTNTKTRWKARLTARGGTYAINYPDIPCGGIWKLIDKNSQGASFTEIITSGTDRCDNNSHVMTEKMSADEILCRYTLAGSRAVIATVTLRRKE